MWGSEVGGWERWFLTRAEGVLGTSAIDFFDE